MEDLKRLEDSKSELLSLLNSTEANENNWFFVAGGMDKGNCFNVYYHVKPLGPVSKSPICTNFLPVLFDDAALTASMIISLGYHCQVVSMKDALLSDLKKINKVLFYEELRIEKLKRMK